MIAIQGINTSLESTDFTLDPQLLMGGTGSFVETNRKEVHETFQSDWFYKDRVWDGKVDNLQIWGRAFNADEVVALWNNGKGTAQVPENLADGLIGHWPFDGDLKDSSGNGRHGTGKNSPGFGICLELFNDPSMLRLNETPECVEHALFRRVESLRLRTHRDLSELAC